MKLFQRINGIKKKKIITRIICICILFVAVSNVFMSGTVVVYAWSAGGLKATIASIVVSMLMSSGAGVTNMDWLSQLNSAYGVESTIGTMEDAIASGLLSESGGALIDTGLSDAIMANSAYTDLGLDTLFSTTADDVAIQAGTVVASGGANLAAEGIGAVTLGTVGQAVIAVGAGIGLGVLANHVIEKYGKLMFNGQEITTSELALNNLPDGGRLFSYYDNYGRKCFMTMPNTTYAFCNPLNVNTNTYQVIIFNLDTSKDGFYKDISYNGSNLSVVNYVIDSGNSYRATSIYNGFHDGFSVRPNNISLNNFMSGYRNGTIDISDHYSPDVIGVDGNQVGNYENDKYNFPDLVPYYNPSINGLNPIPMDEYMDFARMANDNTEDGLTGVEIQGELFQDFINPYLMEQIPEVPEPEPDYSDPSVIPDQPTFTPKDDVNQGDIDDADAYTVPGLMERFPFCIPNDILAIFKKFNVGREAPFIEWNFVYDKIGLDYVLRIDFSEYDSVASVLRTLELIAFVVGLGVATRKLIGG